VIKPAPKAQKERVGSIILRDVITAALCGLFDFTGFSFSFLKGRN